MAWVRANASVVVAGAFLVASCGGPRVPVRGSAPRVVLEPAAGAGDAAQVVRIHVFGLGTDAGALALFRGALDAYHAGRIRANSLPSTLYDLRIDGVAWRAPDSATSLQSARRAGAPRTAPSTNATEQDELVFAPSVALAAGETYSTAALGYGALESFTVGARLFDYAGRTWPPHAAPHGAKRWVFCGEAPMPPPGGAVTLEPAGVVTIVGAGADSRGAAADRCFHLDVADGVARDGGEPHGANDASVAPDGAPDSGAVKEGGAGAGKPSRAVDMAPRIAIPPPVLTGVSLDPAPVFLDGVASVAERPSCPPEETALGPGCLHVQDDRVFVRTAQAPLLWVFDRESGARVVAAFDGEQIEIDGFTPGARASLTGSVTDLAGNETHFDVHFTLLAPLPHLVVNEVLANPIGPERAGEWIELVNDGDRDVDLAGWSLEDGGGTTALPNATIPAGAYALVVPAAYDPASGTDVPPAEGTLLVRVPALGTDGLSNAGERLRLRSPAGDVVSEFPALAASKAGVSFSRRTPASADDDPAAFGASAPPGASPGAANVMAEP